MNFKPYRWKDSIKQRNSKRFEFVSLFHWIAGLILIIAMSEYAIGLSIIVLAFGFDVIAWRIQAKDKKRK